MQKKLFAIDCFNISHAFFFLQDSKKVRLFDRSELNTYRDNLAFSKLVSGHLLAFLTIANGQQVQEVAQIFSKETKRLLENLKKAEQENMAFLHTSKWKENMFQACRLTLISKTLNQVDYEGQDFNGCKEALREIFSFIKTSNHSMTFNNLLYKLHDKQGRRF